MKKLILKKLNNNLLNNHKNCYIISFVFFYHFVMINIFLNVNLNKINEKS
jgi:hypothetical protein